MKAQLNLHLNECSTTSLVIASESFDNVLLKGEYFHHLDYLSRELPRPYLMLKDGKVISLLG